MYLTMAACFVFTFHTTKVYQSTPSSTDANKARPDTYAQTKCYRITSRFQNKIPLKTEAELISHHFDIAIYHSLLKQ